MIKVLQSKKGARLLTWMLCAWSILVLLGTLYPFAFTTDAAALQGRGGHPIEWIPFSYVCPKCGYSLGDKTLNLGLLLPFGFLAALRRWALDGKPSLGRIALAGFLFSLSIEASQYFLPARNPSSSDLLLNTLGGLVGAWLATRLFPTRPLTPQAEPSTGRAES